MHTMLAIHAAWTKRSNFSVELTTNRWPVKSKQAMSLYYLQPITLAYTTEPSSRHIPRNGNDQNSPTAEGGIEKLTPGELALVANNGNGDLHRPLFAADTGEPDPVDQSGDQIRNCYRLH